ncbi:MAG: TldD/PmbA family protein, partial [Candidatus Njordarchaeales archaeon]
GSDVVTVIDDPTIPNSYGFYLYDDEGVKAKPRFLIKEGYINEFLHNRETAVRFGTKSNAAARASAYNREPIVRMANTYVAPGDYTFDELLEDIRFGVYIKTFGEWNIDDRRFNMRFVGKEAWLIENGRLTKLVRNPILEITTPAYYASIDAIDKNLEFEAATCGKGDPGQGVPVWTGGPNIRLRNIRVLKG